MRKEQNAHSIIEREINEEKRISRDETDKITSHHINCKRAHSTRLYKQITTQTRILEEW